MVIYLYVWFIQNSWGEQGFIYFFPFGFTVHLERTVTTEDCKIIFLLKCYGLFHILRNCFQVCFFNLHKFWGDRKSYKKYHYPKIKNKFLLLNCFHEPVHCFWLKIKAFSPMTLHKVQTIELPTSPHNLIIFNPDLCSKNYMKISLPAEIRV